MKITQFELIVVLLLLTLTSCASTSTSVYSRILSLGEVEKLSIGSSQSTEILNRFGSPGEKDFSNSVETWTYYDSNTRYQRLTVVFDVNKILQSVTWIPGLEEPERELSVVLARYSKKDLRPVRTRQESADSLETQTTYSDDKSMAILFDDSVRKVEAIAWSTPDSPRAPSQAK